MRRRRLRRWIGFGLAYLAVLVYALADLIAGEDTLAAYSREPERDTVAA